jgi:hypothetical protein
MASHFKIHEEVVGKSNLASLQQQPRRGNLLSRFELINEGTLTMQQWLDLPKAPEGYGDVWSRTMFIGRSTDASVRKDRQHASKSVLDSAGSKGMGRHSRGRSSNDLHAEMSAPDAGETTMHSSHPQSQSAMDFAQHEDEQADSSTKEPKPAGPASVASTAVSGDAPYPPAGTAASTTSNMSTTGSALSLATMAHASATLTGVPTTGNQLLGTYEAPLPRGPALSDVTAASAGSVSKEPVSTPGGTASSIQNAPLVGLAANSLLNKLTPEEAYKHVQHYRATLQAFNQLKSQLAQLGVGLGMHVVSNAGQAMTAPVGATLPTPQGQATLPALATPTNATGAGVHGSLGTTPAVVSTTAVVPSTTANPVASIGQNTSATTST